MTGNARAHDQFLAFSLRCDLGVSGAAGRASSATIVLLSAARWRWGRSGDAPDLKSASALGFSFGG